MMSHHSRFRFITEKCLSFFELRNAAFVEFCRKSIVAERYVSSSEGLGFLLNPSLASVPILEPTGSITWLISLAMARCACHFSVEFFLQIHEKWSPWRRPFSTTRGRISTYQSGHMIVILCTMQCDSSKSAKGHAMMMTAPCFHRIFGCFPIDTQNSHNLKARLLVNAFQATLFK